ncbi:MAG: polyisoprenyl-teichoic acid--peptidoglycan teichoic acid transferase [Clostridiales bacterium]|jgi:LCP family protein required for cell wall assembly|nr:polyisoprenyl-teichoic acid--peptidoglycan teichoic acid transferase [Clostridiales bacterium]MDK2990952.1 polyisoprenyl-teichoic acid--peptidoglycan teichoic acid transferase [Clostridiales bacterium]
MSKDKQKKRGCLSKALLILGIIVLFIVGGVIGYSYMMLNSVEQTKLDDEDLGITEYKPPEPSDNNVVQPAPEYDVINIALFGIDSRDPDQTGRSDTMMIASVDKKNKKVKLTSLMRDMYVDIPGHGGDRMNHAYAYGGPALAIKTINTNFKMDISDYVTVDFFNLPKIIDELGGVDIDVKSSEIKLLNSYLNGINKLSGGKPSPNLTKPGMQRLDGRQALAYSRIRYVGNGDYERTERQRRVMEALFQRVKEAGPIQLPGMVASILQYCETSLSKGEILELGLAVLSFGDVSMQQYRLPVDGTFKNQNIRGMAVLVPDIEKNTQLLHEFIYEK